MKFTTMLYFILLFVGIVLDDRMVSYFIASISITINDDSYFIKEKIFS